jgi:hypothetical protein
MKLAIDRDTCRGRVLEDEAAVGLAVTHRIVDLTFSHDDCRGGRHYRDVWGGTWRLTTAGETECTTGAMEKWS